MSEVDSGATALISRSAAWRRWQMLSFESPQSSSRSPSPNPIRVRTPRW